MKFFDFYSYYDLVSALLYNENWSDAVKVATLISVKDFHSDYNFLQVKFTLFL